MSNISNTLNEKTSYDDFKINEDIKDDMNKTVAGNIKKKFNKIKASYILS